jgi:hypothetical protein
MVLDAWALHRLQAAYLRLRGRSPVSDADSVDADRRGRRKWRLLDVLLVGSALLALIGFLSWYFGLAGTPSGTPWPDEVSGQ